MATTKKPAIIEEHVGANDGTTEKETVEAPKKSFVKVFAFGVKVSIDPDVFDDLDVFEDIRRLNDNDPFVLPRLLNKILGDDWERVKEALKVDGRVTASRGSEFLFELVKAVGAKN